MPRALTGHEKLSLALSELDLSGSRRKVGLEVSFGLDFHVLGFIFFIVHGCNEVLRLRG